MAETDNIGGSQVVDETLYVFLDQLEEGKQATVRVMICRAWDTHIAYGKYLTTDFIASDEKGNVIQLAAKNNIAHCFIHRLKEGAVYFLSDFDVVPNKPDYRLLNDNQVMIQLQGSMCLRKQPTNDTAGFIRHPFNCVAFEALTPTNGKYLVGLFSYPFISPIYKCNLQLHTILYIVLIVCFFDVVGYAVNVGSPVDQKSGATTLDFDLADDSGKDLCGNLEYCAIEIPASAQTEGTLTDLLRSSRKGKGSESSTTKVEIFKCTVHVANVRTKNGWFKIQLEVTDGTSEAVVVLFDETAEKLVKATAKSLVAEVDEDSPSHVLPNPIANLINTTQTLLLKVGTHYEHGSHESFNCLRVLNSTPKASVLPVTCNKAQPPTVDPYVSTPTGKKRELAVTTPAKESDRPNRRK
ncbi:uncharacterized protein [Rutidosis leptorrhynchoides]|uniref:uncharacterized protein n=1 Tax=Rutidosis leptorrhynchoides TaxID=125765 RepID=UPI003A99E68B